MLNNMTDGKGNITEYSYDALGQVTNKKFTLLLIITAICSILIIDTVMVVWAMLLVIV